MNIMQPQAAEKTTNVFKMGTLPFAKIVVSTEIGV